ncbi:hypothetical protein MNBD_ALPHA04-1650 [hydrothermal vent metagenome]|uniref:Uncharacterized protein n=1 Tax=hydrothermal vent metagenome TaxID=652676 RepID=A0A3B0RK45_9ZZZZ
MHLSKYNTLVLVGTLVVAACGQTEAEEQPEVRDPVPAATIVVQPASQNEIITTAGTVRLRRETELGFTSPGKVAAVRYDEGDQVRRGAVLAALDTSNVSADLNTAKAERDRAEAEYARMQKLFADGWVTKARLEQAEASSRAAIARVESAGFANRTANIIAPSSGIILRRNIDAGQIVSAGMTALVLGETSKGFVLRVPLADRDASRIRVGMPASVTIAALGEDPIQAVVSEKDGRADERTGTFEVSFLLPSNGRLRSGQLGIVNIEVSRENDGSIAVPATAIFGVRSGEGLVFVVDENNRVKQRSVIIGELTDDSLEISSGLIEGDVVVTRGVEKLQNGDEIKPIRTTK